MAKNVYIGGSFNKIDYSSSSYAEQINLGELTIAFVSVAPSSYNNSITPVWNDSLGKFVFPDGVTTTLVSSGGDWFNYVGSNANYVDFVSFAIPTENPNAYYSYEVDEAGAETRGKFTHSFVEDVARKIKSIYLGVDGVARKIKKVYIGDENRLARLCYELNPSYLTFSSPSSFTLKVSDTTKHWDGTLEYSTDTSTWTTWDGTTLSSATSGSDNVLHLRGTRNTVITGNNSKYKWVLTGTDISCIGNIENLLDYATVESGAHPTMANNCYYNMFNGCTALTQAPALLAMTLTPYCYRSMFQNCTSLTQAPALPAMTLTPYCYNNMFVGCTALTQAPALPAMTLTPSCYYNMFYGCTSLTQAPALPATTLADNCYYGMFQNCTRLTQAPALPATTLTPSCYRYMFQKCTRLTQASALPATTLASNCYNSMFFGCTSLTQASALPATTLANNCYYSMFRNCTSLIQAPTLPPTTLTNNCYQSMFEGCTALTQAPALPATTLALRCYQYMFQKCTGLTQAPALPATTLKNYCYQSMFSGCTKIKLSNTQTGEYTVAYCIPFKGTGKTATNALYDMFASTGGTFTGTPKINTTYYLSNTNTIV